MIELGTTQKLRVLKQVDFGYYLEGEDLGEILLPVRYAPEKLMPEDEIEVFLYLDSEDRPIATTEKPLVEINQVAHLRVVAVNEYGAFLNWGLSKDLFAPFAEQRIPMLVGKSYVVCVYMDNSGRIAASSKLSRFLYEENEGDYVPGEKVELLIAQRTDLGYKAVIGANHLGMIHTSDIFQTLQVGDRLTGFIKGIRPDGRINLTLQHKGQENSGSIREKILAHLAAGGGHSTLTDKAEPEVIYATFGISKASYKKALGLLYKAKQIVILPDSITLAEPAASSDE